VAAAPAAAVFEFRDSASYQGRSVLVYRAIEFHDAPVRPLPGEFKPVPGALYGLVPVGPKPETALSIVWCPKAPGGPQLWLDANGDGRLSAGERHTVSGRDLAIPATITVQLAPQPKRVQRTLLFRRSTLGEGLRYAVRGFAEGTLALGRSRHRALVVDGNADGCFDTVGQDRVWIDLDGDGRFDALTEQFPLGKPIVKDGEVYVVRSDPLAAAVYATLRSAAQGRLRLTLAPPGCRGSASTGAPRGYPVASGTPRTSGTPRAAKASAELISDLGELVAIDKLDQPVAVPAGEYRVSGLELEIADPAGQAWTYSFREEKARYYAVQTGKETAVTMLGKLAMTATTDCGSSADKPKPGETVVVSPRLVADESLYLSRCAIGNDSGPRSTEAAAEVLLVSPNGKTIDRGITGFS
jgi:hypothetical protein